MDAMVNNHKNVIMVSRGIRCLLSFIEYSKGAVYRSMIVGLGVLL